MLEPMSCVSRGDRPRTVKLVGEPRMSQPGGSTMPNQAGKAAECPSPSSSVSPNQVKSLGWKLWWNELVDFDNAGTLVWKHKHQRFLHRMDERA